MYIIPIHHWWVFYPETIWGFPKLGVTTPKSSILIWFSMIKQPFWGSPIFKKPPYLYWKWKILWDTNVKNPPAHWVYPGSGLPTSSASVRPRARLCWAPGQWGLQWWLSWWSHIECHPNSSQLILEEMELTKFYPESPLTRSIYFPYEFSELCTNLATS